MNRESVIQISKAFDLLYDLKYRSKFYLTINDKEFFVSIMDSVEDYMKENGFRQIVVRDKCKFVKEELVL